jgi:hypothetical protein
MKTATLKFAIAGFRSTGFCPFNLDVLPETAFVPSQERPLNFNGSRVQEAPTGRKNEERSSTRKQAAIVRLTSVGRFVRETMQTPRNRLKANAPRRSHNINSTFVTKDLIQSKSGKETNLDLEKTKTEKREREKKKKIVLFWGGGGGCG